MCLFDIILIIHFISWVVAVCDLIYCLKSELFGFEHLVLPRKVAMGVLGEQFEEVIILGVLVQFSCLRQTDKKLITSLVGRLITCLMSLIFDSGDGTDKYV
jgi:hypothetical protein